MVALLLAAILRIWGLCDESLWLDEGFTARRAQTSIPVLMSELKMQTQGVAYYLAERVWCSVFGTSVFALRFPSVLYGTLSVLALYLLGRRLFSKTIAGVAALILAVNPFAVFYSQDARPYALFFLTALASLYFFISMLEKWNAGRIAGYLFFTELALYTHPYGPFLLVAHIGGMLILRRDDAMGEARRRTRSFLALVGLILVLFLPQFFIVSSSIAKKMAGTGPGAWIPLSSVLSLFGTFKTYFMTPGLAVIAVLTILIGLLIGWRREALTRTRILFLLVMGASFTLLPWLVSRIVSPIYIDRYTIPAVAAVALLLAWSLGMMPKWGRIAAGAAFVVLTTHAFGQYHTTLDKDPWQMAANEVNERVQAGDRVVLVKHYTRDAFGYYFKPPPDVQVIAPWITEGMPPELADAGRVILVKSYMDRPTSYEDSLLVYIANGRFARDSVLVAADIKRNRWSPSIRDITVMVYEPLSLLHRD